MINTFPELETKRLKLIEIRQSHLDDYYKLFSDERVTKYYNIVPFKKKKEGQKHIDWFASRYNEKLGIRWGISMKGKDSIIGTLGFNNYQKGHRSNLRYELLFDFWNRGIISEALYEIITFGFNSLGINRIEAEVMQGNIASEKVLLKLGFKNEGILRDWMLWNGRYYNMTMFSLLKSEF